MAWGGGRLLTILDEYTRECLAIRLGRKLTHHDVLERLADLFVQRGVPAYLRSDNGAEFTARVVRTWLTRVGVQTLYIAPGKTAMSNPSTANYVMRS